jgi:CO/xanthine dehydrogenase Mo-binding subunit
MAVREYEPNAVLSTKEFNVVGTRPVRHDGADKVTGRALYGADFAAAGLLHGKVLRSPHAHAVIKSIDTSKAEALDGVHAVVTAADYPDSGGDNAAKCMRDNLMASDKALYQGHAIAAVAAINAHVAEEAIALIEVEYDALPAVLTAPDAMKDGAPLLHTRPCGPTTLAKPAISPPT